MSAETEPPLGDYRVFETAWGWAAIARTGLGVCAVVLPSTDRKEAEDAVRQRAPGARSLPRGMDPLVRRICRYFDGERVAFEADLDFSAGTPFQRRVWQAACMIPYGQVRSYAGLGMEIGRPEAARAVASALSRNPIPLLVPCHRVVRSNGGLGGFSGPGGVAMKRAMLDNEAVPMVGEGEETRVMGG